MMECWDLIITFALLFSAISFLKRRDLFPGLYDEPMVQDALRLARNHRQGKQRFKL